MSPQEFGHLYMLQAPPPKTEVVDWETYDSPSALRMRTMSCRLRLSCGHQIPLAVRYPSEPGQQAVADYDAKEKLNRAVTHHVNDHDCAAYVRQQTLAKITARLKQ